MLDLRSDHIDYASDLLCPPEGFRFERAVATTFSLDLAAILAAAIPLAFGAASETLNPDPLLVLRALRKIGSRLTVFYQAGQIPTPGKDARAFRLLDKMLVPVTLPKTGNIRPAFHPKTWIIEFKNETGESKFRFAALSRNLTFDRSWDVSVTLESGTDRRQTKRTKPLVDFLEVLSSRVVRGSVHAKNMEAIIRNLRSHPLSIGDDSKIWTDFEIIPQFGSWKKTKTPSPILEDPLFSSDVSSAENRPFEAVIASPFLSDSVIANIARRIRGSDTAAIALLTRPDAFRKLSVSTALSFPAWAFKDAAVVIPDMPQPTDSMDDPYEARTGDLHAKFFFYRRRGEATLLLGSMNATESGLHHNVELMVRLFCDSRSFNARRLLEDLFGENPDSPNNPFERIELNGSLAERDDLLEKERKAAQDSIREFCCAGVRGRVEPAKSGFALALSVPPKFLPPVDALLTIRPLSLRPGAEKALAPELRFDGLTAADLSEFFVLVASMPSCRVSRVVQIYVEGIANAGRDEAVIREIIDTNGGWLNYLDTIFSDDPVWASGERQRISRERSLSGVRGRILSGLYEKMLRTACSEGACELFGEAERILGKQTGRDADSLRELLERFSSAFGKKGRRT